jgi:hypothetical protein
MRIPCFAAAAVAIGVSAGSALAGGNPFLGEIDTFLTISALLTGLR